jgi:deoxyribodipyrimidine photo-lyase
MDSVSIFWFRRDLRLEDNTALDKALSKGKNVIPLFIFDEEITSELPLDAPRITFIYDSLYSIDQKLKKNNSSLLCLKGNPIEVWKELLQFNSIKSVYANKDYEPYARNRDLEAEKLLSAHGVELFKFRDQVIHEENEVLKKDDTPYTVFTP